MTAFDFMQHMGENERFYIFVEKQDVTGDQAVTLHDVKVGYEERKQVLDALEKELICFDAVRSVLYCD